jgi:hypothetical protein
MPIGTTVGNYMASWCRAYSDGNFAYTNWGGEDGVRTTVKTSLTDGTHTVLVAASNSPPRSTNNIVVIPGTTIMCYLAGSGGSWNDTSTTPRQMTLKVQNIATGNNPNLDVIMPSNSLPFKKGNGAGDAGLDSWQGHGQAALMWVPEVGKFAAFGTTQTSSEATFGAWPSTADTITLFWITPPADVQTNYATGTWTCTEEILSFPVGDTKARTKANRGPAGSTYQCCFWSSKLRCFIHIPAGWNNMCFFIRTSLVP